MDSSGNAPRAPGRSQYSDKYLPGTRPARPDPPIVEPTSRWLFFCPCKPCKAVFQLASALRNHLADEHENQYFRENIDGTFTIDHQEESTSPPLSNHQVSINTQPSTSLQQTPKQQAVAAALQKAMADSTAMPPPPKSSKSKKKKMTEVKDLPGELTQEIASSDEWNFKQKDGLVVMYNTTVNMALTFAPGTITEIHWAKSSNRLILYPNEEQCKSLGSKRLIFDFESPEDAAFIKKGLGRRDEGILFREENVDDE